MTDVVGEGERTRTRPREIVMPRMLRRAAVLGATAHVAASRGAAKGAEQQAAADAAAAPPPPPPETAAPVAPAAAGAASADSYAELMKLKELLDAGVLTQEEFDAQKAKILAA